MSVINNLMKKLKESSFGKSVITLSIGQGLAQVINLISIPIISRVYSKNSYGDYGIITSTAIILIGTVGLGLGSAIMSPKSDEESQKVLRAGFLLQAMLAFIICLGMLALMPFYRFFETQIPYPAAVCIMFIYIILNILSTQMNVYINRLKMNKVLFINPLIYSLSTLLLTLPLGLLGYDKIGMYIAAIVSLTISNIHMLRKANPFTSRPLLSEVIFTVKNYKNYILFQYPSNLVGTYAYQMPNQVFARNFGNAGLSDYDMCNRVFGLPISLLATPIQTVYFRTVSQKYRDGEDIAEFSYSLLTKLMLVAIIPIILVMAFGEYIFAFVLGEKWAIAGQIASIMSLHYLFTFCYSCVTYCRVVIQKQKINLYMSVIQLIFTVISLFIGVFIYRSIIGAIICYTIVSTALALINIVINFYCLKKLAVKFLVFSLIYCIITISATLFIRLYI